VVRPGFVGTQDFASAVIQRLGEEPKVLRTRRYSGGGIRITPRPMPRQVKPREGIDIFTEWADGDRNPNRLGEEHLRRGDQDPAPLPLRRGAGLLAGAGGVAAGEATSRTCTAAFDATISSHR
jgi:hypothetical protein